MTNMSNLPVGAKILSASASEVQDLGPLQPLLGTWTSAPGAGWNTISVPAPPDISNGTGFLLEIVPYIETLTFQPAVIAANRGPVVDGEQVTQNVVGLIYEQKIISDCDIDACTSRGLGKGTEIHAETGMILFTDNSDPGVSVARLGTIPHGDSILLMGSVEESERPDIPVIDTLPTFVNGDPVPPGYLEFSVNPFDNFNDNNPNETLANQVANQTIVSTTTLTLNSENQGGILNIPFIKTNVDATKMNCTYWIEEVRGDSGTFFQLQYSQVINLVFPPAGAPATELVNWPHADVNTLTKVSE